MTPNSPGTRPGPARGRSTSGLRSPQPSHDCRVGSARPDPPCAHCAHHPRHRTRSATWAQRRIGWQRGIRLSEDQVRKTPPLFSRLIRRHNAARAADASECRIVLPSKGLRDPERTTRYVPEPLDTGGMHTFDIRRAPLEHARAREPPPERRCRGEQEGDAVGFSLHPRFAPCRQGAELKAARVSSVVAAQTSTATSRVAYPVPVEPSGRPTDDDGQPV